MLVCFNGLFCYGLKCCRELHVSMDCLFVSMDCITVGGGGQRKSEGVEGGLAGGGPERTYQGMRRNFMDHFINRKNSSGFILFFRRKPTFQACLV